MRSTRPSTVAGSCSLRACAGDSDRHQLEARLNYIHDADEPEIVAVIRDISKRKAAEEQLMSANEQLKALSETDTLTAVANRRRFDRAFEAEFKRCQRSGSQLSVLFIDIDKFKSFNDTYGHSAGDDCIRSVAQALSAGLKRPGDLVARYGGRIRHSSSEDGAGQRGGRRRVRTATSPSCTRAAFTAASPSASAWPEANAMQEPRQPRCWRPPTAPFTWPRSRGETGRG
jgi:Diguanylate cyclase, GGDEF domain